MAQDDHSGTDVAAVDSSHAEHDLAVSPGTAIIATDTFENPGFPAHRPRVVDEEPKRAKRAQRTVYTLFYPRSSAASGRSPRTCCSRSSPTTSAWSG